MKQLWMNFYTKTHTEPQNTNSVTFYTMGFCPWHSDQMTVKVIWEMNSAPYLCEKIRHFEILDFWVVLFGKLAKPKPMQDHKSVGCVYWVGSSNFKSDRELASSD